MMVTEKPLVSIVTPSYNQEKFLEAAIQSVLAQQDNSFQLEYLVVDGGSMDGSLEIIQRYADQLAWWVSEPDKGQAEAINKGLQTANGEFIAWLNSDDLYLPGAIASAVRVLQSDPDLGMVYGDALSIDAQGVPINRLTFGNWGLTELACFRIICQPAVFMRKTVLDKAGYLDTGYHYMLDHHLWLRMASLAPIRHVGKLWAAARQHAEAKNVAQAAGFSQETMRLMQWVQTQPEFSEIVTSHPRKIMGGATRLSARYTLDGGLAWQALKTYIRAFRHYPAYTLQHWHRIVYAVLCLLGGKNLSGWYRRYQRKLDLSEFRDLKYWSGIRLEKR
ncbi:MAG: glycosyltransferase [Anaerolineales bacterium]|nr:glycosyltransferase [Anaerolineales bacterium]